MHHFICVHTLCLSVCGICVYSGVIVLMCSWGQDHHASQSNQWQNLSFNLRLSSWARLTGSKLQKSPYFPHLPSPELGFAQVHLDTKLLYGYWGSKLSSFLSSRHFALWVISSAPCNIFYKPSRVNQCSPGLCELLEQIENSRVFWELQWTARMLETSSKQVRADGTKAFMLCAVTLARQVRSEWD